MSEYPLCPRCPPETSWLVLTTPRGPYCTSCDNYLPKSLVSTTTPTQTTTGNRVVCPNGNCGSTDFEDGEDGSVCIKCGAVAVGVLFNTTDEWIDNPPSYRYYQRKFYLNELMSQLALRDPPIPPDILRLIRKAHHKRKRTSSNKIILNQEYVFELCRNVSAHFNPAKQNREHWVKLKRRLRVKYRMKNKKKFKDLEKYAERWRSIIYYLSRHKQKPPQIDQRLKEHIYLVFKNYEPFFETHKHGEQCKKNAQKPCSKTPDCRHSITSYAWFFKQAIKLHYANLKADKTVARSWYRWLRLPQRETQRRYKHRFWIPFLKQHKISRI